VISSRGASRRGVYLRRKSAAHPKAEFSGEVSDACSRALRIMPDLISEGRDDYMC
jgi:hypothetical protein